MAQLFKLCVFITIGLSLGGCRHTEVEIVVNSTPGLVESNTLREAFVDYTIRIGSKKERSEEAEIIDNYIRYKRKLAPDFLMVTPEDEQALKSGRLLSDTESKIKQASSFLEDYSELKNPTMSLMLRYYNRGDLLPVECVLLAHEIESTQRSEAIANSE